MSDRTKRWRRRAMADEKLLISLSQLAEVLGWNRQRALRWARREGIMVQVAGRWVTTRDRIRLAFPDVADRMMGLSE